MNLFQRFGRITKFEAFIICVIFSMPFFSILYPIAIQTTWSNYVYVIFSAGALWYFYDYIEAGTKVKLIFMGKDIEWFWKDGICFVPAFNLIRKSTKVRLPWDIKKLEASPVSSHEHIHIDHRYDQNRPRYDIKADATLLQLETHRTFTSFLRWIFVHDNDDPDYLSQRIGLRIVLLAFIVAITGKFISPVSKKEVVVQAPIVGQLKLLEPKQGECVNIPSDGYARIGIWSLPTLMSGIEDEIIVMDNGTNYKWSWEQALKDNPVFSKEQIVLVRANGNGSICF